jgi:hypothetical protein
VSPYTTEYLLFSESTQKCWIIEVNPGIGGGRNIPPPLEKDRRLVKKRHGLGALLFGPVTKIYLPDISAPGSTSDSLPAFGDLVPPLLHPSRQIIAQKDLLRFLGHQPICRFSPGIRK